MPKMKTKSGAKKRFKLTASGKIKRKQAYKRHLLEHKTSHRTRKLKKTILADESNIRQIKRMLLA